MHAQRKYSPRKHGWRKLFKSQEKIHRGLLTLKWPHFEGWAGAEVPVHKAVKPARFRFHAGTLMGISNVSVVAQDLQFPLLPEMRLLASSSPFHVSGFFHLRPTEMLLHE